MAADSFGTFLESLDRETQRLRKAAAASDASTASDKVFTLIADLRRASVPDLMTSSGLGVVDFSNALHKLRDAGLVEVARHGAANEVELTPSGELLVGSGR